MVVLEMKNITKYYNTEEILTSFNLNIQEGERLGLIGANGSGKTTVFKLITGEEEPTSGKIYLRSDCQVGLLDQSHNFSSTNTIYEECEKIFSQEIELEKKIRKLENKIARVGEDSREEAAGDSYRLEKLLKKYNRLQEEFSQSLGYGYPSKIRKVAIGMGFSQRELDKKVSLLSGGEKTRLGLIKLLLKEPDLLLLDEPTNHLDIASVEWLENYLRDYPGAVIVISHDRYFLDNTIDRLVEIKAGKNEDYSGNYSYYLEEREKRFQQRLKRYQEQQKKIKKIKEQIEQYRVWGRSGDNESYFRKAKELENKLARMDKLSRPTKRPAPNFTLTPNKRVGHEVLKIENLAFKYQDKQIFSGADLTLYGGEKAALIGPNGSGKTTLLNIIMDKLKPQKGSIALGPTVARGYYSQEVAASFSTNLTVLEALCQKIDLTSGEARNLLAKFLFRGDDVYKNVADLSGGERSRLRLLQLVFGESNFLLLDEPTNHLDLKAREVLEEALQNYQGTVLLVSHDRYFIDQIANNIVELYQEKLIKYHGDYSYFKRKRKDKLASKNFPNKQNNTSKENAGSDKLFYQQQKEKQRRERKQSRKLEELEQEIINLENKQEEIEEKMIEASYQGDIDEAKKLEKSFNLIGDKLEKLYAQWEKIV